MPGPLKFVARAAIDRVTGAEPGRLRAGAAAAVTGVASAAVTYHLLRSHSA